MGVLHFDALDRRHAANQRRELDVANDEQFVDNQQFVMRLSIAFGSELNVVDDDAAPFESGNVLRASRAYINYQTPAVPEPASVLLMLAGMAGLAAEARRRRLG